MARAIGLGSQFRGKLGNMVGYLSKNRVGRYVQSVKVYQPVVENPQTVSQALARLPLGPVQRFYNHMSTMIQRGWEGVAYGENAKNEYLSYNMANFRGPYLQKGEVVPYPGPFLVTKGSLGSLSILGVYQYSNDFFAVTNIRADSYYSTATEGDISRMILAMNPNFAAGEQLTFIKCCKEMGQVTYRAYSMYLNVNSTESGSYFETVTFQGTEYLAFYIFRANSIDDYLGGCVIRSAPYGESGFRRSTSFFCIREGSMPYYDENAMKAAIISYRTEAEDATDWEDDPTPGYQSMAYIMMVDITQNMVTFPDWSTLEGTQCLGYVTKGGQIGIFKAYNEQLGYWQLLDGSGALLYKLYSGSQTPVRYSGTYEPCLVYDSSYGTIYNNGDTPVTMSASSSASGTSGSSSGTSSGSSSNNGGDGGDDEYNEGD